MCRYSVLHFVKRGKYRRHWEALLLPQSRRWWRRDLLSGAARRICLILFLHLQGYFHSSHENYCERIIKPHSLYYIIVISICRICYKIVIWVTFASEPVAGF